MITVPSAREEQRLIPSKSTIDITNKDKSNNIMDHIHNSAYAGENLKATLNCYQIASADSLSGPGGLPALVARMWYKVSNT